MGRRGRCEQRLAKDRLRLLDVVDGCRGPREPPDTWTSPHDYGTSGALGNARRRGSDATGTNWRALTARSRRFPCGPFTRWYPAEAVPSHCLEGSESVAARATSDAAARHRSHTPYRRRQDRLDTSI